MQMDMYLCVDPVCGCRPRHVFENLVQCFCLKDRRPVLNVGQPERLQVGFIVTSLRGRLYGTLAS